MNTTPRPMPTVYSFPIMSEYERATRKTYPALTIPWAMIEPHNAQALKNHCDQSLRVLARRGGLSRSEACAILEDRAWKGMTERDADAQLVAHVAAFGRA